LIYYEERKKIIQEQYANKISSPLTHTQKQKNINGDTRSNKKEKEMKQERNTKAICSGTESFSLLPSPKTYS
jgi:hypothetical protein